MISLLALLAAAMACLTVKLKRLVWKEDKVMPLALLSMTGSVIMYMLYYICTAVVYTNLKWIHERSYTCSYVYFNYSGVLLLAIGVVLNAHKWIQFLMRIYISIKAEKVLERIKV